MNILIVNDDGIESKGLEILARALAPHGKTYVSAPMHQQSGKSQAISLNTTMKILPAPLVPGTIGTIMVDGSPADATRAGINLFNVEFDLVVSGINHGRNIASDVLYSGTVGAALEAKIYGVNAIAISADTLDLDYLYDETIKTLDEVIENKLYAFDGILNINFPKQSFTKPLGIMMAKQGKRYFHSEYVRKNNHEDLYYLKGSSSQFQEDETSDVWAFDNGYISITPITLDRTHHAVFEKLKKKS